jgi:hypothetical protein
MEFKEVKALDIIEPKSVQEVEKDLLDKHEQSLNQEDEAAKAAEAAAATNDNTDDNKEVELKDEDVLSYIGKR